MTDGASAALQGSSHTHITINTWSRTLPASASEDPHHLDQHVLLQQYTRFVDHLDSGEGVLKHVFTPLRVSKATTETDFRWLSQASKLSNSDVAKYTLSHRSQFIRENEDLDHVYEPDFLEDFHSTSPVVSTGRQLTPSRSNAAKAGGIKPLHMYGRKSTARLSLPSQGVLPYARSLKAFRKLLESASSQESKNESIQSSTPQIVSRKKRRLVVDSPATSSALERSSDASPTSSLSPSPSPPMVQSRRPAGFKETRPMKAAAEPKGRQPLRLQSHTSAVPADQTKNGTLPSVAAKGKSKPALRPITRKLTVKGIPAPVEQAALVHKSLGSVISHARRLQSLGGSWPLKRQRVDPGDVANENAEEELHEETTEIIEDYTLQIESVEILPAAQARPANDGARPSFQQSTSIAASSTSHRKTTNGMDTFRLQDMNFDSASNSVHTNVPKATSFEDAPPFAFSIPPSHPPEGEASGSSRDIEPRTFAEDYVLQSTNISRPPSPPLWSGKPQQSSPRNNETNAEHQERNAAFLRQFGEVSHNIPDISVTLATSPLRTQSQRAAQQSPVQEAIQDYSIAPLKKNKKSDLMDISTATFLSLAFDETSENQYFRQTLPTRCIPKFRTLSKPISPSHVQKCLVPEEQLHQGGMFNAGYLGPGRRGFWELPLQGNSVSRQSVNKGEILGIKEESLDKAVRDSSTILWTLPRLRSFLVRVKDIASLGRFGVVTICTTASSSDASQISLEIGCQSSMALMLRTIFDEIACSLDNSGNEMTPDAVSTSGIAAEQRPGERWLDSGKGVRLVWWDEMDRLPVLAA